MESEINSFSQQYSYLNKEFILSPEALILRNLADSLYPDYLTRVYKEGRELKPHPIPALDGDFINSKEGRWFRVLSETIFTEIVLQKKKINHTVLFFGSARLGTERGKPTIKDIPDYYSKTIEFAYKFTCWAMDHADVDNVPPFSICTGGGPGIMEAGNRGAIEAGGQSIGMNIDLPTEQTSNEYISDDLSFNFHYFFTRKYHFLKRARAIIAFPGGFGSMDELFETLTLVQTKKIVPLKIILFGRRFWEDVIKLDKLLEYGTIAKEDLELVEYCDEIDPAMESLTEYLKQFL